MASLDLASPRVIAIDDRGRKFSLTVKRIDKRAWLRYFEGIVNVSENVNGERVNRFDSSAARLDLVESALIGAEGYPTANGQPVTATEGWQKLLPLAHRLTAGLQLVAVAELLDPAADAFTLGFEDVYLDAFWGTERFTGLRHRFRTPSGEHQARLSRASSRSVILGGSRRGTTRWLGAQATLADLYDDLIEEVEGYSVGGTPLSGREQIVAEMDTFHKVAAAELLFSPAEVAEPEEPEAK